MTMRTYTSKPTNIQAVQWTGDNWGILRDFAHLKILKRAHGAGTHVLLEAGADGAQGWVPVPLGHWVVRKPGDDSDYWPVDPDYFDGKYVEASS